MHGTEATPWWGRTHVRLGVLLTVLVGVAAFGVPTIAQRWGGGGTRSQCGPSRVQLAPNWSLAGVHGLVDTSGLPLLVGDGTLDREGLDSPDAAWNDRYPTPLSAPDPAIVPADPGYEIVWWSSLGDHQAAEVYVFRSASDAAQYVALAAMTPCRVHFTGATVGAPAGGRSVVWTNPVGAIQADVIFRRGARVYVTEEVPPLGPQQSNAELVERARGLACELPAAACGA